MILRIISLMTLFLTGCTHFTTTPSSTFSQAPARLALVLPLEGNFSNEGQAVRDGFLAAYYENAKTKSNTIAIIDTSKTQGIEGAYQEAVAQGATLVIGPLVKQDVYVLTQLNKIPVTTLALNQSRQNVKDPANLYYFTLSPQEEAAQVANKAWQDGRKSALVIAPEGEWGQSIARAFKARWKEQGGKIVDEMAYNKPQLFAAQIQTLLRIQQNQSNSSQPNSQDILAQALPAHRQDADMVFLAAQPSAARQFAPLVKFYYAGNMPIYATSLVYSGTPNPGIDADLDGVIFCDMPWVLEKSSGLNTQLAKAWPKNYAGSLRLYGLGIDAYKIAEQLNAEGSLSNLSLQGVTGKLSLNAHSVQRQLLFAKFQNGVPVMMEATSSRW